MIWRAFKILSAHGLRHSLVLWGQMNVVTIASTVFKSSSGILKVDMRACISWWIYFLGEFIQALMFSKQIEGLKAMVAVSTIWSSELGSFAKPEVPSHNDARSCVNLPSFITHWRNLLRCFTNPVLALQIPSAQRTNSRNGDYRF